MPKINHTIPDFSKQHDDFQRRLDAHKSVHEPLRPKEFNMTRREEEQKLLKANQSMTDF